MKKGIDEITEKLEQGVLNVFSSENYKLYLDFVGKFYNYSVNNSILIFLQMPSASFVAGYQAWKTKFKRQVKRGEKAIKIMAPIPHRYIKEVVDAEGNKTEKHIDYTSYRSVNVFDISQTEGEDVPSLTNDLTADVKDYEVLRDKLIAFAPVPVAFEHIDEGAKGYFSSADGRIVVEETNSPQQAIKTLVHEIAHSMLHGKDGAESKADRNTKEVQAESVAYIVCSSLGIDTEEYSFGYIAGWSKDKKAEELTASMEVIKRTAVDILKAVA